jgi:hypothetical protein
MNLKMFWELLKMLPFFIDLYKQMKAYAKERGIQNVDHLAKVYKNETSSAVRAKLIADMFK